MDWNQLLCERRERSHSSKNSADVRTEFHKDYHRIIGSASFRRLQDKAQVYPLRRGDFVRTRLTHSLEVSSFARSLGDMIFRRLIRENKPGVNDSVRENCCDILECAGLIHDIGNPPFGHYGEFAIREWFKNNFARLEFRGKPVSKLLSEQMMADFLNFEGNAQVLRVVSRLHCLTDMDHGMNLTFALLNTIIKYPTSSLGIDKHSGDIKTKKMGFFTSEQSLYEKISRSTGAVNCRYPLTFILEAADDIAYLTADIEDATVKGYIGYSTLIEELSAVDSDDIHTALDLLKSALENAKTFGMPDPEKKAVQQWIIGIQNTLIKAAADEFCGNYNAIMRGEMTHDLLSASSVSRLWKLLGDISYRYAFRSRDIVKSELAEHTIMFSLLDKIVPAVLSNEKNGYASDLTEMLSENYFAICKNSCEGKPEEEQCYRRILLATDCISGMTDGYATSFFRMLNGLEDF
ncbi:MAG: deoxyguanosinetriphosphate triphosphohydrolase [Oscillospiraceae bacterium]|nr:deoxyguanosinetriphosphate triphosphohydrolase [Oscillospiraceae bacterium]